MEIVEQSVALNPSARRRMWHLTARMHKSKTPLDLIIYLQCVQGLEKPRETVDDSAVKAMRATHVPRKSCLGSHSATGKKPRRSQAVITDRIFVVVGFWLTPGS